MFCRKLMDGLRCIDDFTSSCLDDDHRAYFNTLYTGTTQVIMDLCQTGQYQTGEWLTWPSRQIILTTSEYLKHARCMRDAQTEYESCVDVYQLRIKALNKVRPSPGPQPVSLQLMTGRDRHTWRGGRQRPGPVLQLPAVPPLQRAGGELHLRDGHRRVHQEVPGPDVWSPGSGWLWGGREGE